MEPVKPNQAPTPEQPGTPAEQLPQPAQTAPSAPATTPQPLAAPAPTPVPAPAPAPATPQTAQPTASPTTADDVDVIEKEWVDAAQNVVKQSADDPHKEEEGFEGLQVDYLKKRYGKDIKQTEE